MKKATSILGKVSAVSTALTLFSGAVVSAYAAESVTSNLEGITGVGDTSLLSWVKNILNLVIGLAGLVSVAILIFAGYGFITANGDEDKIAKSTKSLTFAIVGLVICLISVLIVTFVLDKIGA